MTAQRRLPGMPLGPDDVFVCSIDGGAPPPAPRRRRGPAGTPPAGPVGVWLVLRACPACRPHAYCRWHWPKTTAERESPGST